MVLEGNAVDARMLAGRLEVFTGVKTDVVWSVPQVRAESVRAAALTGAGPRRHEATTVR